MPQDIQRHIGELKDAWRKEFREVRSQITRLESRLAVLKEKLNNADEILAAAKASNAKQSNQAVGTKYATMGVTDAVRAFFSEHRFTRHSISDVMRQLQHEGLRSGAQNLRDIVSITCRRLHKEDQFLDSELTEGVRMFWVRTKSALLRNEQAGAGKPTPAVQSGSKLGS